MEKAEVTTADDHPRLVRRLDAAMHGFADSGSLDWRDLRRSKDDEMRQPAIGPLSTNLMSVRAKGVEAVAAVQPTTAIESGWIMMPPGILEVGNVEDVIASRSLKVVIGLGDIVEPGR